MSDLSEGEQPPQMTNLFKFMEVWAALLHAKEKVRRQRSHGRNLKKAIQPLLTDLLGRQPTDFELRYALEYAEQL